MLKILEYAIGCGVVILFTVAGILIIRWFQPGIARHALKSGAADSTELGQTLEDVQVRLGELDQLKQRIGELEERVDFAERLFANQREGQRLGPPQE